MALPVVGTRMKQPCDSSSISTRDAADFAKPQRRFSVFSRRRQIDLELSLPVIVFVGIDEHLLHRPTSFVLGRNDVSVAGIARFRIEPNVFVLGVIRLYSLRQLLGSPRSAIGSFQ